MNLWYSWYIIFVKFVIWKKKRNIDDRYEWYKDFIYKLFFIKVFLINLLNKMYIFYCKNLWNWMKEFLDLRN